MLGTDEDFPAMPADPKLSLREDRPETTEAELLARVRFEFGELLKITPPVRLENYLSNLPAPQRLVALPTLLELDLAWAYDWGQPRPSCDDYVARLPEFKEAVRSFFAQLDSRKGLDDHEDTGELPPPAETLRWRRGLRLGSYELLDALGQGGFGEVWKGRNHNDGSLVAIKSVGPTRRKGSLKSLETITKHNNSLAREREILRELSELDLRVPKLLDEGQDGSGRPYIVMELVPGHDLQHQRERGDWSWRRCVLVTLSIAEALRDLLAEVGRTYVPVMLANARALAQGAPRVETEVDGQPWVQQPFAYQGKCVRWLRESWGRLAEADRAALAPLLAHTGCLRLFEG